MRIVAILGTRPEAIKMAPVIFALRRAPDIECKVCVTGQHRHLLDQVLQGFGIAPDADLNLMQPNQTLAGLTSRAVSEISGYLQKDRPHLLLVQGDTTTVLCASLAAFYHHVSIGHVEAGLRTGDLNAPWPEEMNRILTTRLAAIHFAPTESARQNLLREGVLPDDIHVTGNPVIDALLLALEKVRQHPPEIPGLTLALDSDVNLQKQLVLVTGHRRENFGGGLESICSAIANLARIFPDTHFIYPMHLNPQVRSPVERWLGKSSGLENVHLIEPLSYFAFVSLMSRATVILTDSGGIQEEAPSLGKPVLVMRQTTERPEAVQAGTVKLVGTDHDKIVSETSELLRNSLAREAMSRAINPYGDGKAAERIAEACHRFLKSRS
jgi:UDP-N-acetylglucosamine 2-epimerase (non-hydrolysing)